MKSIDDYINDFVETISLDELIIWAKALGINPDIESWLKDNYLKEEDNLRINVSDALFVAIKIQGGQL